MRCSDQHDVAESNWLSPGRKNVKSSPSCSLPESLLRLTNMKRSFRCGRGGAQEELTMPPLQSVRSLGQGFAKVQAPKEVANRAILHPKLHRQELPLLNPLSPWLITCPVPP